MDISQYQVEANSCDFTKSITISTLGLTGEIGEVASVLKKRYRDRGSNLQFSEFLRQELGDTLWYLTSICNHLGLSLEEIATQSLRDRDALAKTHNRCKDFAKYRGRIEKHVPMNDRVGRTTAISGLLERSAAICHKLLSSSESNKRSARFKKLIARLIGDTLWHITVLCNLNHLKIEFVAFENLNKIRNLYDKGIVNKFDKTFPANQQFPRKVCFKIKEIREGNAYRVLVFNDKDQIGDPLSDNSHDEDFYRYHDVFHFTFMAMLGWSPVIRSMLKLKRKDDTNTDENEDGARATILEELLSHYIFCDAKEHNLYENADDIDLRVLKTIKSLTQKVEVSACTHTQWREAILKGYSIFRQVIEYRTGVLELDLDIPNIVFKPID